MKTGKKKKGQFTQKFPASTISKYVLKISPDKNSYVSLGQSRVSQCGPEILV